MEGPLGWPRITKEMRPGTRWWWMGNAVNKEDISCLLKEYHEAGLGWVEITPIYGVRGYENQFIDYLSPEWLEVIDHTVSEAAQLNMGVDMITGTGWNFGGPSVSPENAAHKVLFRSYTLTGGGRLTEPIKYFQTYALNADIWNIPVVPKETREAPLHALVACSDNGEVLDLTNKVEESGRLDWEAPPGEWKVYAVFNGWSGKQVKRAAPGQEGSMIDYFSKEALMNYLSRFDKSLEFYQANSIRAYFNDSYEIDGADWTINFFIEFENRRDYDLRRHLPALFGEGSEEKVSRIKSDYRETISELLLEEFTLWTHWAHEKGSMTRNQAHGGPGNLLDLYTASDIPETESEDPLEMKFATSAAHLTGKKLVSSESCTAMGEHFTVSLADVKSELDRFLIGGVNHNFYHGTTYSPPDVPFPGWTFYAPVNFIPSTPIWRDFPQLNGYVTRVQSFLQTSHPDNDVLLYFPVYDVLYHNSDGLLYNNGIARVRDMLKGSFYEAAKMLWNQGYTFDYISDRLLADVKFMPDGVLESLGEMKHRIIVVPNTRLMPLDTLERLVDLAEEGATIIFQSNLPDDVPGYHNLVERRESLKQVLTNVGSFEETEQPDVREVKIGGGRFLVGENLKEILEFAKVPRESMTDRGLWFNRQSYPGGYCYFIKNMSEKEVDDWIPISVKAKSVVIFDPMQLRSGLAAIHQENDVTQVYLQLQPGETCVLRTFSSQEVKGQKWEYLHVDGEPYEIKGTWDVTFIEGGPTLPKSFKTQNLVCWTKLGGAEAEAFAGTAKYTLAFRKPDNNVDDWVLDLGEVHESARVRVNEQHIGTLICPPFRLPIGKVLHEGINELEIEVTNLAANRIRYMDRNKIPWKEKFYNVGIRGYGIGGYPFDASNWPLVDSGLFGPVRLIPVK